MMNESSKSKQVLTEELESLKRRIRELEQAEARWKQVEEALNTSEETFRNLIENAPDAIYVHADARFLYLNPMAATLFGADSADQLIGSPLMDRFHPSCHAMIRERLHLLYEENRALPIVEQTYIRLDGSPVPVETHAVPITYNRQKASLTFTRDISQRKRAEELLRESEERYRELTDSLPISISTFEVDAAGSIISFNRTALEVFRYNEEDYKKGMNALQFFAPEEWQRVGEHMGKVIQGTSTPGQEFTFLRKDGSKFIGLIYASPKIHKNKTVGIRGVIIDITERKRAEEQIHRQSKLLAAINRVFFETLTADSEETVANTCLKVAQEITDSKFGFIGEITPKGLFTTTALSDPGWEACRIPETQANVLIKDMVIRGIWGQVILKKQSLIVNDPVSYPDRVGIPEGHPSLTSFLGVPLKDQDKVIGMIAMANCGSGYTADHQQDMEALSVAFVEAIRRKQAEVELQRTLKSLRKAVGATIQVMVSSVETRDPYTAGHQTRSADLARAIAMEMGLPQEKIDGIRMAGSIHDIGKLSIPAEILSKPTKLSEIEFSLIKEHARQGYEILKNVESPWPLAEIVLQHHEWMDGSGYPRGLKGEEILIEARILAVADVVEAMASHRPYRPALGLDVALKEIEKNRGVLYDSHVVDTCLRVFQEKGYQIEGT
jgi:PAS domain S-box-containing protein